MDLAPTRETWGDERALRISGGGRQTNADQTRFPGFELEPGSSGYYKVVHVYKHGPADKAKEMAREAGHAAAANILNASSVASPRPHSGRTNSTTSFPGR